MTGGALERLLTRGRALAERRARAVRVALVERIDVAGVAVSVEGDDVVLRGPGLRLRALAEPGLRWIGSVLR